MHKSLVVKILTAFFLVSVIPLSLLNLLYLNHNKKISESYMNDSLLKIVDEKAQIIDSQLKQAEIELINLATIYEMLERDQSENNVLPTYYKKDPRGVIGREPVAMGSAFSNKTGNSISNIFLPRNIEITSQISEEIIRTERLDPVFSDILNRNGNIIWIYVTTKSGLMRLYPYFDNIIFDADRNPCTYPYYTIITDKTEEEDEAVWTNPYYDYGGKGWVISCSKPIFRNGELDAVVSIDVSLHTIEEMLADFRLGKSGFAFLIDNNSNIIYHPDYIPEESKRGDVIKKTLLDPDLSEEYKEIIKKMISMGKGIGSYGDHRIIAYTPIEYLNGSLGIEIDSNDYIPSIYTFSRDITTFAVILVLLVAVFGIYIFYQISRPILMLTQDVERIASGDFSYEVQAHTNDEIGILADSFNMMNKRLKSYTEDIIKGKKQLESVFNSIGGLLMIMDTDYTVKMVNRQERFKKHYGEDPIGKKCYEVIAGAKEPCADCPVKNAAESKRNAFSEVIIGKEVYHNWSYPIKDAYDNILEIIVYSNRVTDMVLLEQELAQAEKLAGIGQLVAGVMHELKNPLAIIKGASYLLHNNLNKEENQSVWVAMEEIDNSISRAEKIIYSLLDFSRKSNLQTEQVDICGLVRQIILFEREKIVKNRIDVIQEFEVIPMWVNGNLDSLKHIFLNIIANAIDAMSEGGKLTISGRYTGENSVQIGIKDTGPGIDPGEFEKIFEPFYTTKGREGGTGLGLWIVKREMEKNKGSISIRSEVGEGTAFILTFSGYTSGKETNKQHGQNNCVN